MTLPSALNDYVRLLEAETRMANEATAKSFDSHVRAYLRSLEGIVDRDRAVLQAIRTAGDALHELFKVLSRNAKVNPPGTVETSKLAAVAAIGGLKEALRDATPSQRALGQGLTW